MKPKYSQPHLFTSLSININVELNLKKQVPKQLYVNFILFQSIAGGCAGDECKEGEKCQISTKRNKIKCVRACKYDNLIFLF